MNVNFEICIGIVQIADVHVHVMVLWCSCVCSCTCMSFFLLILSHMHYGALYKWLFMYMYMYVSSLKMWIYGFGILQMCSLLERGLLILEEGGCSIEYPSKCLFFPSCAEFAKKHPWHWGLFHLPPSTQNCSRVSRTLDHQEWHTHTHTHSHTTTYLI